jgi:hypothetical protein
VRDQAKVAAIEFSSWAPKQANYEPPPQETWSDQIAPTVRLAWTMMFLSKHQLVDWCTSDPELAGEALRCCNYARSELVAALDLVTSAEARLTVGVVAAAQDDQRQG